MLWDPLVFYVCLEGTYDLRSADITHAMAQDSTWS